jgi:tetratricopeptide (TPR) repeat protein
LRSGKADEGIAILKRLLGEDASRREPIATLGWAIGEQQPEPGFRVVELVTDVAIAENDWPGAAAILQEFVTRVPNHIPALMRLVEICVDGGLEATMFSAQAQLADAYIAAGMASEARFIAEDLVAREPWERANVERFRRALELLGEPDPDAIIAQRLSGESPFTSTDLFASVALESDFESESEEPAGPLLTEEAVEREVDPDILVVEALEQDLLGKPAPTARARSDEQKQFGISAHAIDMESIFGGLEEPTPPPTAHAASDDVEVDLSIVLDKPKQAASPPPPTAAAAAPAPDLDSVFGNLRDQAAKKSGYDDAEKEYKRGLALRSKGDIEGCIQALENASRSPKLRFATSWLIARLYRDRDKMPQALEWLERAAQSPAPTADDGHQLLYELAEGLEKVGETARALAVLLELQADAGSYRDIDQRISRLTKVQA